MMLRPGESRTLAPVEYPPWRPGGMVYRIYAAQDQGSRGDQQDSIAASSPEYERERGILCVLSDGMGGLADGKEVSEAIVDEMISCFFEESPQETPERILLRGCVRAQHRVLAMQQAPKDRGGTLVAALVRNGRCSFLSVGDSRIMLYRGGGLIPLTRDQNRFRRVENQIGLGYLPPEARTDATLRALSMFIGRDELERVDRSVQSFPLTAGDRLLLMSDGVYEALTQAEMARAFSLPVDRIAGALIDEVLAKENPKQDNCTALLLACDADPYGGAGV